MVPRITDPKNIQTPDYYCNTGETYDLKRITGNGKNTLSDALKHKKKQSNKFIFWIRDECGLSDEEILEQIGYIFRNPYRRFVKEIVLLKDGTIQSVFERK